MPSREPAVVSQATMFVFASQEITRRDTSRFLAKFHPEYMDKLDKLGSMFGGTTFGFEWTAPASTAIHRIPSIRSFVADLHNAWPCWFFFLPAVPALLAEIALCVTNGLQPTGKKYFAEPDVLLFLARSMRCFEILCNRAGIDREQMLELRLERMRNLFSTSFVSSNKVSE